MKLKKIIYSFHLVAIAIVAGLGCRKSQFNINQDQNNPTDSTVAFQVVLPAALHASGAIVTTQWGTIQNWMGYWARSGTYAPNVAEETYQITTAFGNGIWNNCYDNNYDYQIVQSKAHVAGAFFYEGIARIMKAQNFQILVDVYGNVPYTAALKGSGNPTPAYDKGIDIYKDLFRQLDTAINLIKASTDVTDKDIWLNDIMFGDPVNGVKGNLPAMKTKWIKFANTLKLRLIIHAYAAPGFPIAAEMAKIISEGTGFLGAGENAQVQPGYKSDKPNPFYNLFYKNVAGSAPQNNVYYKANEWGIDYISTSWLSDPRTSRFYEAGSGGLHGVAYGLPPVSANAAAVLAGIGPGLYKTSSSPQLVLSSAESFFLQAEARQRNILTTGPTAAALLDNAKLESMTYLGVASPATALSTYNSFNATYPDVDITGIAQGTGGPVGGLFTILSQKWIAMNGINTLETWTDYRRVPYTEVATKIIATGAAAPNDHFVYGDGGGWDPGPPISVAPQNTSTKIPVRYLYPQTEYNYNPKNVGAEGTVDAFTSRIFWDIN
ncbi:MAG: SusD/RagB family nutrient-binding outer membrane lipoprotein [Chitinophagaceae bacterium]